MNAIQTLSGIASALLLSTAALTASPPAKMYFENDRTPQGDETDIGRYSNVILTSSGAAVSRGEYSSLFVSSIPGQPSTLLKTGSMLSATQRISSITEDRAAINSRGDIAFFGQTENPNTGVDGSAGLFLLSERQFTKIATNGAAAPGGGLFDLEYADISLSNNGRYLAFRTDTVGGPGEGVYIADLAVTPPKLKRVAITGDNAPTGGKFDDFRSDLAVINTGIVVFASSTTSEWNNIYLPLFYSDGADIKSIAGSEDKSWFQINDRGDILVTHYDSLRIGTVSGVHYIYQRGDTAPSGGKYQGPSTPMLDAQGNVAFECDVWGAPGGDDSGIFLWTPSGLKTIAMMSDSPPGGGLFESPGYHDLYPLCTNGESVYFKADTTGGSGIFVGDGTKLSKIVRAGDSLAGQTVTDVEGYISEAQIVGQNAFNSGGTFLFYADLQNNSGLFIFPYIPSPEISVAMGTTDLKDGKSKVFLSSAKVGSQGKSQVFTVRNAGDAQLKNLKVSLVGGGKAHFKLIPFKTKSLAPGAKTSFKLRFSPKKAGARKAKINITSNDSNENPFDFTVGGTGRP